MSDFFYDDDTLFPYVMRFRADHIKPMCSDDVRRLMTGPAPIGTERIYRRK